MRARPGSTSFRRCARSWPIWSAIARGSTRISWPRSRRAQRSPAGLLMPHQSLLYAGRVHACANLPQMMHIARELCGGQICVTPNAASFAAQGPREWLEKFYSINNDWLAEDSRKLLAFARDLLNSDYAGHRLTFVQFAQSPHFNHLNAVYNAFDFSGPLEFVKKAADLSDRVTGAGA